MRTRGAARVEAHEPLLTPAEAAAELGVSADDLDRRARAGEMDHLAYRDKRGVTRRYFAADIAEMALAGQVQA